jgi:hypothetical protein
VQDQIAALRGFDWGNYLFRCILRAGFVHDDAQEQFQNIVVKLLLNPGKLFKGWNPAQHGPLERRFRASVWNAIRNAQEKQRNYRRWMVTADPTVMAERNPARQADSAVLDEFRRWVADVLGPLAVAVFDQRLEGRDTKDLVGRTDLRSPSIYAIKKTVQAIKELAQRFATRLGGNDFADRVARAMEEEAATVAKRQRVAGGQR